MHKFLFLIIALLSFGSCAVVEGLNGGPVDAIPPRVISNGMLPSNGSINFSTNRIELKFKEYIRLNNPTQTISIMPEDVKVNAEVKGKSLVLSLDGILKENTTYQITMNGAVKDITESNDSLMQYVFSTGNFIDSLKYTGFVVDAKELSPVKNCFVGLYSDGDSAIYKKPIYYASTNELGQFSFNYLKTGSYRLYAFEDGNKDAKWQKTERVAFYEKPILVDTMQKDTVYLHLFKQTLPSKLTAQYTYPAKFTVASNNPINLQSITLDSINIPLNEVVFYEPDSLSFMGFLTTKNNYKILLNHIGLATDNAHAEFSDTLTVRVPSLRKKGLKPVFEVLNSQNSYQNNDSIVFSFSDNILSIDTSKMELLVRDSIKIPLFAAFDKNTLTLHLKGLKGTRFNFNCLKEGIVFENHKDDFSFTRQFDITDETMLGKLILDLSLLPSNAIVEVFKDKNHITAIYPKNDSKITLSKLQPGYYSFKAYLDVDNNKQWTTGDFYFHLQPEKIIRFEKGVQVRSNWDIEATLEPINDER